MHERAELIEAKIDISSRATEGTRLALNVPFAGTK
jgi:signal transduction histidine kinase